MATLGRGGPPLTAKRPDPPPLAATDGLGRTAELIDLLVTVGYIDGQFHQREQAFVEYGRQQNVVRPQDIYHGDFSSQSGYQCAKAMLQSQNGYPPALLVATHDPDRAARAGFPVLACTTHAPGADGIARSVFGRPTLARAALMEARASCGVGSWVMDIPNFPMWKNVS